MSDATDAEVQEAANKLWAYAWENASPDTRREFGRLLAHAAIHGTYPPPAEIERVARRLADPKDTWGR